MTIRIQRVYEPVDPAGGTRVLVDRLWPRGLSRDAAAIDHWLREIAPSNGLRQWFGHDAAKWPEFLERFHAEMDANPGPVAELRALLAAGPVTLVYAAREERYNNAAAIRAYLERV